MKLRWPVGVGRTACVAACVVGSGTALGQIGPVGLLIAGLILPLLLRWKLALGSLLMVALATGWTASARGSLDVYQGELGSGLAVFEASVVSDPALAIGGWSFVARVVGDGPLAGMPLMIESAGDPGAVVGARIAVTGRFVPGTTRLHRTTVAGRLAARSLQIVEPPQGPIALANALRDRVHREFPAEDLSGALMRGFLIGDTAAMDTTTLEEMRRAGLLHFVAVSGGNVAIFLGGVWLLLGLFPLSPRVRAFVGLAGIGLFVLVTRWEPSVLRAGTMLGLLLLGRLAGIPVDGWTALGGAASLLLLVAPQLIFDVGFQLSALATAGLLVGSHLWNDRRPTFLWRSLGATVAAQIAVTPLLLWSFGSVPAFSALANVAAAPLVTFGTAAGWGRVFTGIPALDRSAEAAAGLVLDISSRAAQLPQVGWTGLSIVLGVIALTRWRTWLGLGATAVALVAVSTVPGPPEQATVAFLDVGQGDATLLMSPAGDVVAIDTGPDPLAYLDGLRRHGVGHIDLLILTHSDGDHVGGLEAVADRIVVDRVWYPDFTEVEVWKSLLGPEVVAKAHAVRAGTTTKVGDFVITVVSPTRRYATDNNGSVVVWVEVNGATVLLAGDIESVGQAELPPLAPDVMLVPHHGSATSDLDWLERGIGPIAVLSYGDNSYGHPATDVIELLTDLGPLVLRTEIGDVVVSFPGSGAVDVESE
ncbi:MAG: MBL fold metallo-hydrolase [bacterium]|nr:MBL fold metallo-hydrolase [bacterium]